MDLSLSFQAAVRIIHAVIRASHFFFKRHLGPPPSFNFLFRKTFCRKPLQDLRARGGDDDCGVATASKTRLKKERDFRHGHPASHASELFAQPPKNIRMNQGFELSPSLGISKHDSSDLGARRISFNLGKERTDFGINAIFPSEDFVGQPVRIQNPRAPFPEKACDRAFSRSETSGEPHQDEPTFPFIRGTTSRRH